MRERLKSGPSFSRRLRSPARLGDRIQDWRVCPCRSLWRLTTTTNWLTRKCPKTASAVLTRWPQVRDLHGDPGFRFELASPLNPAARRADVYTDLLAYY